jgi:carboxymethylenebutenolidase
MSDLSRRRFLENSAAGVAATGIGTAALSAQDWARRTVDQSPRRREWVTVRRGARSVESFLAHPAGSGRAPAMVVIHEIFGMADWVEDVTDQFAQAGWLAIAPDLLSGMAPNGGRTKDLAASDVGAAIQKLPPEQITADLNACADYCKNLPACNGKVCVVGFSWGGGQAFRFATDRRDLAAAFVFYGTGPEPAAIARIQAPVYGFYAGTDTRVDSTVPPTQEQMKAAGKVFETVTYDGAQHGFMRAGEQPDATDANRKAREAAWVKLKALFPNYR